MKKNSRENSKAEPAIKEEVKKTDEPIVGERVQKLLAHAGLGSRREIEGWIREGLIRVNGQAVGLGDRIFPEDEVRVRGRPVNLARKLNQPTRLIIYNKPAGQVVTRNDPEGRETIFKHLPKLTAGRWISVGRLDINTLGLMILTTNGELANRLMHPSQEVDREYAVRVLGEVTDEILANLKKGVELDDGYAKFTDIVAEEGEGANRWYKVAIMEGRNRIVRRLWESQGLTVSRLQRVRHGPIFLPKGLRTGRHYEMTDKEIKSLFEYAGMEPEKGDRGEAYKRDVSKIVRKGRGEKRSDRRDSKGYGRRR
jgi:23S rRNA pseudouridine2605 synthase